jgi:hypothetical protein
MGVDGGSGRAPQTVHHLLIIGAARREGNLDLLRRRFTRQKKNEYINGLFWALPGGREPRPLGDILQPMVPAGGGFVRVSGGMIESFCPS